MASDITSPEYWREINPNMYISDFPFRDITPISIPEDIISENSENLKQEGYFQTHPLIPKQYTSRMSKAIERITAAGLPAVFGFVYDDFWNMAARIKNILHPILGDSYLLSPGDMWIWCVDKNGQSSGWGAHRDLDELSVLHPDGSTKVLTAWIPLTDATPLNGCMQLIPTNLDPDFPENPGQRSVSINTLQYIRALPAEAGSILGWTPLILHWGGKHSGHDVGSRISVAYYLNDGKQEYGCGIPTTADTFVPFWYRLGAIGAMLKLFNGSVLAHDLDFSDELQEKLRPYLQRIVSG